MHEACCLHPISCHGFEGAGFWRNGEDLCDAMQLANLQRGSGGFVQGNQHRSKMFRGGDENPVGGRLSRRAADPAVEAERKAQQERHFAMDLDKVERGEPNALRRSLHLLCIARDWWQQGQGWQPHVRTWHASILAHT